MKREGSVDVRGYFKGARLTGADALVPLHERARGGGGGGGTCVFFSFSPSSIAIEVFLGGGYFPRVPLLCVTPFR